MVTFSAFNVNLYVDRSLSITERTASLRFFRRNVRDETNFSCRFDEVTDPRCPIFRMGDILDSLTTNRSALYSEVNTQSLGEMTR